MLEPRSSRRYEQTALDRCDRVSGQPLCRNDWNQGAVLSEATRLGSLNRPHTASYRYRSQTARRVTERTLDVGSCSVFVSATSCERFASSECIAKPMKCSVQLPFTRRRHRKYIVGSCLPCHICLVQGQPWFFYLLFLYTVALLETIVPFDGASRPVPFDGPCRKAW